MACSDIGNPIRSDFKTAGGMENGGTRLISLHLNRGKTLVQCLAERTDYSQNPEKTEGGKWVSTYECDPMTADEEFLLSKRQYQQITGRSQERDVIAYQIRQSFKQSVRMERAASIFRCCSSGDWGCATTIRFRDF